LLAVPLRSPPTAGSPVAEVAQASSAPF
jgi:hypothetical protein